MSSLRGVYPLILAGFEFASPLHAMPLPGNDAGDLPDASDKCHRHLHGLVSYLRETAEVEGLSFETYWQKDGSVLVRSTDYSQHMRWVEGVMQIRFDDPVPSSDP